MIFIVRANGEVCHPRPSFGHGRPAKYPFRHLEVGDYFETHSEARRSLATLISQGRLFGRDHRIEPSSEFGRIIVRRTS